MFKKPTARILWWAVFTLIADVSTVTSLISGNTKGVQVIAAAIMTLGLAYLIVTYKIDGPSSYQRQLTDERVKNASNLARSNAFYFLFLATWLGAFLIELPSLAFLKQNPGVLLASIAMLGLLVELGSFMWYKYRV